MPALYRMAVDSAMSQHPCHGRAEGSLITRTKAWVGGRGPQQGPQQFPAHCSLIHSGRALTRPLSLRMPLIESDVAGDVNITMLKVL